jgi:hypothetical protein
MPLSPGTQLGPYVIVSSLGAGGMGEVYRARDTRLKREVAIKILPDSFAHDPERLARFQREAQVLASLNHPHIAAIYGLEESDGVSALVMELVHGIAEGRHKTEADVRALGLIPIVRAERTPALQRGQLMRYLAELAWAPDAILHNTELRWRELRLEDYEDYTIDFNAILGRETTQSVAYAVCYIRSGTEQQELQMLVGSDDQAKVYLNGKQVYKSLVARPFAADRDTVQDVELKAGLNV